MKDKSSGRPPAGAFVTVEDPKQVRLLSDAASFRYFKPFLARDRTVSQAAGEVGCNLDTMLYRVKTFLAAGLLQVIRLEPRAGRPVKHYRSSFDSYFVPLSATAYSDFEEEVRQALGTYENVIARQLARARRTLNRQGQRIFRDKKGEVSSHTASSEDPALDFDMLPEMVQNSELGTTTAAEMFTDELWLTDDEAKLLLSDLYRLWRDNKLEAASSRKPYLLRVVMVPLEVE